MTRQLIQFKPLPRLIVIDCVTFVHRIYFGRLLLFICPFNCIIPPESVEELRTNTVDFIKRLTGDSDTELPS